MSGPESGPMIVLVWGRAEIDIFRFDDQGKIVEHWDVLQVIPLESAHGDTMC